MNGDYEDLIERNENMILSFLKYILDKGNPEYNKSKIIENFNFGSPEFKKIKESDLTKVLKIFKEKGFKSQEEIRFLLESENFDKFFKLINNSDSISFEVIEEKLGEIKKKEIEENLKEAFERKDYEMIEEHILSLKLIGKEKIITFNENLLDNFNSKEEYIKFHISKTKSDRVSSNNHFTNHLIGGGFTRGSVTCYLASVNTGKTTIINNQMREFTKPRDYDYKGFQPVKSFSISFEQENFDNRQAVIQDLNNIENFTKLSAEEQASLMWDNKDKWTFPLNIFIDNQQNFDSNVLRKYINEEIISNGENPRDYVFFSDYFQKHESIEKKSEQEHIHFKEVSQQSLNVAKEYNFPIVTAWQVRRTKGKELTTLQDIGSSYNVTAIFDDVIAVDSALIKTPSFPNGVNIIIQRSIKTKSDCLGVARFLKYNPKYRRFEDLISIKEIEQKEFMEETNKELFKACIEYVQKNDENFTIDTEGMRNCYTESLLNQCFPAGAILKSTGSDYGRNYKKEKEEKNKGPIIHTNVFKNKRISFK